MKKHFVLLVLVLMAQYLFAQHCVVNHSDFNSVNLTFSAGRVTAKSMVTANGSFSKITMEDYLPSTKVGCPALPVMTRLVEIPLCGHVVATVTNSAYEEYDAAQLGIEYPVLPAQQAYPKSYNGERTFSKNAEVYGRNDFYAEPLVSIEKIGVMRDVNMASVQFSPVAYNPVTNKIRIYTEVQVSITFEDADIPATYEMKAKYGSPLFQVAANTVVNAMPQTREMVSTPIKYLIVANSMFAGNEDLEAFVNWKKRLGYLVEVAYTSDANVGTTTTSIKNFIKSHYTNATTENPAPSFLLLIGDHGQLPAFSSTEENSHVTDLYYATWTTGDDLPDCYYGRFSAQNVSQLTPQIEKSLMYEQYTMEDPSYLGKAVLIAGTDSYWSSTHANGQINYISDNYINTNSTTHSYSTVYQHMYNCSSQASTIRAEIGAGVGWANYTAHGSEDGWYDPGFSMSQVAQMNNADKYGVMIGNCCLTGKFNQDCFAETLLRTPNKGAVLYIGASEVSYWDEDYYWAVGLRNSVAATTNYDASHLGAYDRLFHTHNEAHDLWSTSIGSFIYGGNLSVQSSSSGLKKYYWEIYHVFGDPSIRPYLGMPSTMSVSSSDAITVGMSTYQVQAAPYAYCALTYNNELVGAAFADASGAATITFDALSTPGVYELACAAQNYIPFFKTVTVIVPEGPFVVASEVAVAEGSQIINGRDVALNLSLANLGVANASNVTATLSSTSPYITITQNSASCATLSVNATSSINNAFAFHISADAEDGTVIPLTVTVNWPNGSSTKNLNLTVAAPKMCKTGHVVAASTGANAIAPGDVVTISIETMNVGHAPVETALLDLTCNYSKAQVVSSSNLAYGVEPSASISDDYTVQIGADMPENSVIPFYYHIIMGNTHTIDTILVTVGNTTETFETGDFSAFDWSGSSYPWTVVTESPYEGNYCARSASNLNHNATSTMQVTVTALMDGNISYFRKVSSEENYDKFSFYIDGQLKEELSGTVAWEQASFPVSAGTHSYKFSYSKDVSYSSGSDCAWVDNVLFPGIGIMVVEDIIDPVGVEDVAQVKTALYPNPTDGQITLVCGENIRNVELYDLNGRLLESVSGSGNTMVLNASRYVNGVYFVKTYTVENTVSVTKFVKR